ncbi:hypothetical protein L1049_005591 [Liquidambar formosana]|uniref:Uncharacterized protein n=1 Tax=Liquidambar formosana TaxID=63359 RepID=A0AAP0RE09_LIQFO
MGSQSTSRQICCFCFSSNPKTSDRKKKKKSIDEEKDWGTSEQILSDMSTFSVREQERRLEKAMKEEERVSKEAERVVEWVKQESARMDVSKFKGLLSDDDETIK